MNEQINCMIFIYIPQMVKTMLYANRIAFIYQSLDNYSSSVYLTICIKILIFMRDLISDSEIKL